MMNRENIDYVQSAIGYHFKNERLLYNKPKIWTKNSKNSEFAVL